MPGPSWQMPAGKCWGSSWHQATVRGYFLTCFRKQRARNGADSGERNAPVQPRHFEHVDCGPIAQVDTVRVCGPVWPCAALCGPVRPCVAYWIIPRGPIGLFPEGLLDYSPRSYWIIPRGPIGLFPIIIILLHYFINILLYIIYIIYIYISS